MFNCIEFQDGVYYKALLRPYHVIGDVTTI